MKNHGRTTLAMLALSMGLLVGFPGHARAQWALEARVGSGIPTGELTDGPVAQTGGFAFAAEAMFAADPRMTFYGGISHESFNCDDCLSDLSSTGFQGGIKFNLGRDGLALPWVRGGLLLHDAERVGGDGGWGVGFDSGLGVDWKVAERLAVVPALRYAQYTVEGLTWSFLTLDLGLHVHLR